MSIGDRPVGGLEMIPREETNRLRDLGFIQNSGSDRFNCNVVSKSGIFDSKSLRNIAAISDEFGSGQVMLSSEGTLEIMDIPYNRVADVIEKCKELDIDVGGTGAKIRPVVTCDGKNCTYGVFDSYALSEKIREMFYVRLNNFDLPNKFDIAICGCPNNCENVDLFDVGIMAIRIPKFEKDKCKGCANCSLARACPEGAVSVTMGMLNVSGNKCDKCGICVNRCPFEVVTEYTDAYKVIVGGQKGKMIKKGQAFKTLIVNEESLLSIIVRLLYLYQEKGRKGEFFSELVERMGIERVEELVLED